MGRLTSQVDVNGWNGLVSYTRTATYNTKGQLVSDDVSVLRNDDWYRTLSTYSYGTGVDYALGVASECSQFTEFGDNAGANHRLSLR